MDDTEFDIDDLSDNTLSDIRDILTDSEDSSEKMPSSSQSSMLESLSNASIEAGTASGIDNRLGDFDLNVSSDSSINDNEDDIQPEGPPNLDRQDRQKQRHRWHSRKIEMETDLMLADEFIANIRVSRRVFDDFCNDYAEYFPQGRYIISNKSKFHDFRLSLFIAAA